MAKYDYDNRFRIPPKAPREIKIFTVAEEGGDFTPAEIDLLAYQIAEYFQSPKSERSYDDPLEAAKQILQDCLTAQTAKGTPWKNAPNDFAARVRVKANFDMDTGEGKEIDAIKSPQAVRAKKERESGATDAMARNPVLASFDEAAFRTEQYDAILEAYPELDTPAHRPNVSRLALLYAQQEIISRELIVTNSQKKRADFVTTLDVMTRTIEKVMKSLDIHPDQVRRRLDQQTEGTLADLVSLIDGDEDFVERERLWALTTALQLWWMSKHPNGRGDGPQVHDFEIWHLTRSRPFAFTCECGKHYPNLIEGFVPEELRDYLIDRGVLVETPILPGMQADSLFGLSTFMTENYFDEETSEKEESIPLE